MGAWFHRVWNDEDTFRAAIRAGVKWAGGVIGALMAGGYLAGHWTLGLIIMSIFLGIPTKAIVEKPSEPPIVVVPVQPVTGQSTTEGRG